MRKFIFILALIMLMTSCAGDIASVPPDTSPVPTETETVTEPTEGVPGASFSPEETQPVFFSTDIAPSPDTTDTEGSGIPAATGGDPSAASEDFSISVTVRGPEGDILAATVPADKCETTFDALKIACEASSVDLRYSGKGAMLYVRSIGGFSERDYGPASGWMYELNGEDPGKSCGAASISAGDTLLFKYVTQ